MAIVSLWKLDGDGVDSVGGRNGTLLSSPAFDVSLLASEPDGQSIVCSTTDGVDVADHASLDLTSNWGLRFSFRADALPAAGVFANLITKGSDDYYVQLRGNASGPGDIQFGLRNSGGTYTSVDLEAVIEVGVTYRLLISHDGTNLRLYIDGVQAGTVAAPAARASTGTLRIGADGPSTTVGLTGLMDEVQIDNVAPTAQDAEDDYDAVSTAPTPDPVEGGVWANEGGVAVARPVWLNVGGEAVEVPILVAP